MHNVNVYLDDSEIESMIDDFNSDFTDSEIDEVLAEFGL